MSKVKQLTPEEIKFIQERTGLPVSLIPRTQGQALAFLSKQPTPFQVADAERKVREEKRKVDAIEAAKKEKEDQKTKEEKARTIEIFGQMARSPKVASDLSKAMASVAAGEAILDELIAEREREGGTAFGTKRVLGKQAAVKLNFIFKDVEELGALQKPDLDLLDGLVPQDPLEILQMQAVTGDTILAKLKALKRDFKEKVRIKLRAENIDVSPKMMDSAMKTLRAKTPLRSIFDVDAPSLTEEDITP